MRIFVKDITATGQLITENLDSAWFESNCPDVGGNVAKPGISLEGKIQSSGPNYLFRGKLRGNWLSECVRCLAPAPLEIDTEVVTQCVELVTGEPAPEQKNDENGEIDPEDPDILLFKDGEIDLTPAIRDEIILAVPLGPLCKEACAGLCPVCGGDRNIKNCDCEEAQRRAESKFAVLQNLKKTIKN